MANRKNALIQAAIDKKINPKYILNAVAMESGGNPNAISSSGAIGLTQIVGKTAQHLKIRDRFDPNHNIQGAIDLAKENIHYLHVHNLPINEENMYMMHQLGASTAPVVIKAARDGKDLSDATRKSIGKNVGNGSKTARGYIDANMQHLNNQYKVVFPDN
ncbi:MAG TPA: transglycosylase SLT domain-containing protein [Methylobacter sp.]